MRTVARTTNNVTHYAYYGEIYGVATLLNGTGYIFKAEGERTATLVSYKDPNLVLLGLCAVADRQHTIDGFKGGPAHVACDRTMETR